MIDSNTTKLQDRYTVGLISDTHGLVRASAIAALTGADLLIHAGDIGKPAVLTQLQALAPVYAVSGNVDKGAWAEMLPVTEVVPVGEVLLYVLHNINELDIDPRAAGFHAVIAGHSHKPAIYTKNEVLYVNPGSAGPRRFKLPISVGKLTIHGSKISAELLELQE